MKERKKERKKENGKKERKKKLIPEKDISDVEKGEGDEIRRDSD
jgi:hypothetical protein